MRKFMRTYPCEELVGPVPHGGFGIALYFLSDRSDGGGDDDRSDAGILFQFRCATGSERASAAIESDDDDGNDEQTNLAGNLLVFYAERESERGRWVKQGLCVVVRPRRKSDLR